MSRVSDDLAPPIVGANLKTGRAALDPRQVRPDEELEVPACPTCGEPGIYAQAAWWCQEHGQIVLQRRQMGQAMPALCRRVQTSPRDLGCPAECQGRQRDGGCLLDLVRAATNAGVSWAFEVDPHDGFWDYAGDPIPGLMIERRDFGQVHTEWEPGFEPVPIIWGPSPPPEYDCPHCGTHVLQDPANVHYWCPNCGKNAKERR